MATSAQPEEVPEVSQPVNKNEASDADKAHAQQPPQPVIVTVTEAPKAPNQIAEERAYRTEEAKLQREAIHVNKEVASKGELGHLPHLSVIMSFISSIHATHCTLLFAHSSHTDEAFSAFIPKARSSSAKASASASLGETGHWRKGLRMSVRRCS
jgi:hypothetical protein